MEIQSQSAWTRHFSFIICFRSVEAATRFAKKVVQAMEKGKEIPTASCSTWNSGDGGNQLRPRPEANILDEALLISSYRMIGIDDIGTEFRFSAGEQMSNSNATYDSNPHAVTINSWDECASSGPLRFQIIPRPGNGGRPQTKERAKPMFCQFCKNSDDLRRNYLTHTLRDPSTNRLTCPVLRSYICQICGGTGDSAHTVQHCLLNKKKNKEAQNSNRKSRAK